MISLPNYVFVKQDEVFKNYKFNVGFFDDDLQNKKKVGLLCSKI